MPFTSLVLLHKLGTPASVDCSTIDPSYRTVPSVQIKMTSYSPSPLNTTGHFYFHPVQFLPPSTTIAILEARTPFADFLGFLVSHLHALLLGDAPNDKQKGWSNWTSMPSSRFQLPSNPHSAIQPRSRSVTDSPPTTSPATLTIATNGTHAVGYEDGHTPVRMYSVNTASVLLKE